MIQPFTPPAVPDALAVLPNWCIWRFVQKEAQPGKAPPKPSKVPYYTNGKPRPGAQGTPEDRAQLVTLAEAAAMVQRSNGYYAGVGFAPFADTHIVALDFDNVVADGVIEPQVEALCEGTYTEISPSGTGLRAFFAGSLQSQKDSKGEKGPFGVEVFGTSGFVTVTGNITQTCSLFGWDTALAPLSDAVRQMYRSRGWDDLAVETMASMDDSERALMALSQNHGWTIEQVREYLFDCDSSCDRDTWVKAIMAVHHETGGSPAGLDLVDEWSKTASNYGGRRDIESVWRSFGRGTGGKSITGAWLLRWRQEFQGQKRQHQFEQYKREITEGTDDFRIRETLCPKIAKDDLLGEFEREALAQALADKFKALGVKQPISVCRKLVTPEVIRKSRENTDLPPWAQGWVYVTDKDQFYRIDSDEWLSKQAFNAKYSREMPRGDDGEPIMEADHACLVHWGLPTCTRGIYLPSAGPDFWFEGVKCVNLYRPGLVPKAASFITPAGQVVIDRVITHLSIVCGWREREVQTLIAWLAHNVQFPGVKIRWSPLIKGIEGDGKSLIGNLLAVVMGAMNVRVISPKVLGTDFTGWAEGACVALLEEIKLTGHNRHDIHNALKEKITNDRVTIHRKGVDEYNAPNTVNYIAFTNHADALPLTDTDRRWMVIYTPHSSSRDLGAAIEVATGGSAKEHFDALHDGLEKCPAELRLWLLSHPIPEWFNRNGSAPETDEKKSMVSLGISEDEEAAREVIAEGAYGVTQDVLASDCMVREIAARSEGQFALATQAVSKLLSKLGYTRVPRKVKFDGKTRVLWVRGMVPNDNAPLLRALDATKPGEAVEDLF